MIIRRKVACGFLNAPVRFDLVRCKWPLPSTCEYVSPVAGLTGCWYGSQLVAVTCLGVCCYPGDVIMVRDYGRVGQVANTEGGGDSRVGERCIIFECEAFTRSICLLIYFFAPFYSTRGLKWTGRDDTDCDRHFGMDYRTAQVSSCREYFIVGGRNLLTFFRCVLRSAL